MGDDNDADSPTSSRSRRQKHDKHGRFAALAKLKGSRGIKHKAELKDIDNVYEEVDEKEYSKRVVERQYDDWIVDEGCGYVEDGRDIFDDDLDDESIQKQAKKHRSTSGRKRKNGKDKDADDDDEPSERKGNIRHMLQNMQTKKKKVEEVKIEEDEMFGNLLQELDTKPVVTKPQNGSVSHIKPQNDSVSHSKPMNGSTIKPLPPKPKPLTEKFSKPMIPSKPTSVKVDTVVIKDEPEEVVESASQIIEDCDSMDFDFSQQDLEMMDIQVDESQSTQATESVQVVKHEVTVEVKTEKPTFSAESSWGTMTESLKVEADVKPGNEVSEPALEEGKLPTVTMENGDEVLRMYWWDAYEDPFKQPGVVFLFGKMSVGKTETGDDTWASVCLIVRNIEKHVFLLPRQFAEMNGHQISDEPLTITDVYKEFNNKVAPKHKIMEFKSRSVTKNYAFNLPGVPVEAEYLEVVYPGNGPVLPAELSGETFSRAFGTNTSSLETFLLQRRLKGPCWLDIKGAKRSANPVSWCKLEAVILDPDDLSVHPDKLAPPPLVTMTLNLRIAVNPKTLHNEIVMASCLLSPSFPVDHPPPQPAFQSHFCILTRPPDCCWPMNYNSLLGKTSNFSSTTLHRVESERALLSLLLTLLFRADPDLLVGHDIANFDLPTLLFRLSAHKVENWSRIGRLKRSGTLQHQVGKTHQTRSAVAGRLVCDIKLSAQELIRARSYDLDTLCQTVLKVPEGQRQVISHEEVKTSYSTGESLRQLICLTMQDTAFILRILCELNALPLALQITNIAGNVMSRTLMGGRSERNEFLLLHAFTERGYIPPDKVYGKSKVTVEEENGEDEGEGKTGKARRKKAAYSGGLVLDPKKGFYDNFILLMDFNSLYPSIIQEYNICFTTLLTQAKVKQVDEDEEENNAGVEELMASVSAAQAAPPGVLPTEIRKLVESRRVVKGMLAAGNLKPEDKMQLNIRQMALKLTANSMYGCLGFSQSRFYAKHLAALVTAKGRDILMLTKTLVERMGLDVVYGDTDSIMINTRSTSYDEVLKLGFKVKGEVNKLYHNVELEVDGIFKYLLLLKKKKYAAVTITRLPNGTFRTEQELKGLDIVRRDWAPFASDTGRYVLKLILSDLAPDERLAQLHERLGMLRGQLERGEIPVSELAVAKTLARPPEQYSDKKGLPHVTVALRLNAKGGKKLKQGDTVHYVICNDGTTVAATQRAYHVDELKMNPALKVDVEYYLAHQIHPVISRLVECLDGTDVVRIAECLGLDASNYKAAIKREEEEEDGFKQISQFCLPEEERFKHCDKFKFKCQSVTCGVDIEMKCAFSQTGKVVLPVLENCSSPECRERPVVSLPYLQNCLALAIKSHVAKYYEGWMVCEDPRCNARLKGLANNFHKGLPVCRKCKQAILLPEYSEHDLHQQIYFYRHIFNMAKYPQKRQLAADTGNAYSKLKDQVERIINTSAYCLVDLTTLFKKLQTKKTACHAKH